MTSNILLHPLQTICITREINFSMHVLWVIGKMAKQGNAEPLYTTNLSFVFTVFTQD